MAFDRLRLSKLIELLQRPQDRRIRLIEQDARRYVHKQRHGSQSDERDFYIPFWSDAKQSIVDEEFDLHEATSERIEANPLRRKLYNRLLQGFESIWGEVSVRILPSGPIEPGKRISGKPLESGDAVVFFSNVLSVEGKFGTRVMIYPYFSRDIALGKRHAGLAISAIREAMPEPANCNICFADVVRGRAFFDLDYDFDGKEIAELDERYRAVISEWRTQRRLYAGRS